MTASRFLDWLADALQTPEPAQGEALLRRDHVIGQATGYGVRELAPFVLSLRQVFDGHATLIVDDDREVRPFLDRHEIRALVLPKDRAWAPHPVVARLAAYDRVLSAIGDDQCALLTDVRDVVFQGHPLNPRPLGVEVYDEQDGARFGAHAFNRKWAKALAGAGLSDALEPGRALCVGTLAGPAPDLRRLCRVLLMLCAIPRSGLGGAFGADQAALNLAVHLNLIAAQVQPNFSRVATLGLPRADRTTLQADAIVNPDGSISPVIHQYDRHPHLVRHVNRRWNVDIASRARSPDRRLSSRLRKLGESAMKRLPEIR